jgi:hypothetical protein
MSLEDPLSYKGVGRSTYAQSVQTRQSMTMLCGRARRILEINVILKLTINFAKLSYFFHLTSLSLSSSTSISPSIFVKIDPSLEERSG